MVKILVTIYFFLKKVMKDIAFSSVKFFEDNFNPKVYLLKLTNLIGINSK